MGFFFLVLFSASIQKPEITFTDKPGCTCLVFSHSFGKDRGTFTSPDYPKSYSRGIDCLLYTFIAAPEQIVELTFADFDIYKTHMDCARADYLKFYPHSEDLGRANHSSNVGSLCGRRTVIPSAFYSSGKVFVLEFHSAPGLPVNASGFIGYYRFIDKKLYQSDGSLIERSQCDFIFTSSNILKDLGHFYSPRYPSSYPKNLKCSYQFNGRSNERIRVIFEKISLQTDDNSCVDHSDVIKVFDGNGTSQVIAILCNEASDVEILSSGPNLLIQFVAMSDWPGQGFKATFQFQQKHQLIESYPTSTMAPKTITATLKSVIQKKGAILCSKNHILGSNCDAAFNSDTSKNGTFTSQYYPDSYPQKSHCRYDFLGRGKERIQIVFHDFNLFHPGDDVKECDSIDTLQAFVYIESRMEKIDSFCGSTIPKPIMSNGPRLMLEFRGIYSSRYVKGFKASYYFLENFGINNGKQLPEYPCAFAFNSSDAKNGTFTSPNFPGPYPRDTECHFFFHGNNSEKVQIHFTYFDVEGVLPCEAISASDFVEFSNFMARDRKYNRHCGQLKEFRVESDRKFFRVTFRSNDRLDGSGFKANYQFVDEIEATTIRPNNGNNSLYYHGTSSLNFILLVIWALLVWTHIEEKY